MMLDGVIALNEYFFVFFLYSFSQIFTFISSIKLVVVETMESEVNENRIEQFLMIY